MTPPGCDALALGPRENNRSERDEDSPGTPGVPHASSLTILGPIVTRRRGQHEAGLWEEERDEMLLRNFPGVLVRAVLRWERIEAGLQYQCTQAPMHQA